MPIWSSDWFPVDMLNLLRAGKAFHVAWPGMLAYERLSPRLKNKPRAIARLSSKHRGLVHCPRKSRNTYWLFSCRLQGMLDLQDSRIRLLSLTARIVNLHERTINSESRPSAKPAGGILYILPDSRCHTWKILFSSEDSTGLEIDRSLHCHCMPA